MLARWLLINVLCFFCGARVVTWRVIISPCLSIGVHLSQWAPGLSPPLSLAGAALAVGRACFSTNGVYL